MKITRWGEYGILCCIELARAYSCSEDGANPTGISAETVGLALSLPLSTTQQVLHRLKKAKIVTSIRGPGGGYFLSLPAQQITLKDILLASEGHTFEVMCETNGPFDGCGAAGASLACGLQSVWRELKETVDDFLEKKTLQQVVEASISSGDSAAGSTLSDLISIGQH